jgi:hypothetical protein
LTALLFDRDRLLTMREVEPGASISLYAQDDRERAPIVPRHIYFETTTRT